MTRKIRIGLRIKFNDRFRRKRLIRESLDSLSCKKKRFPDMTFSLRRRNRTNLCHWYIHFNDSYIPSTYYFRIKEILFL